MKRTLGILLIVLLTAAVVSVSLWHISRSRSFQFFGGIVQRVETDEKAVALTFDDGPTAENTDAILSVLRELDIKATFYLIGDNLEANPGEGRKIASEGHELGNHTYSHRRMVFKSLSYIRNEIETTDRLIRKIGYTGDIHFRPPYSKKLVLMPYYLKTAGKKTIMCDVEPESYPEVANDSDKIAKHVVDNVKPGSIILLHVMYDKKGISRNSIGTFVKELKNRGYTFKTVSELMGMSKNK